MGIKENDLHINRVALGIAALLFALGVFAGFVATIFAYLSQYRIARIIIKQGGDVPMGVRWERTAGIVSVFFGLITFLIAVLVAVRGYLGP